MLPNQQKKEDLNVTLKVKNPFNSVRWDKELDAMMYNFPLPPHLQNMLADYQKNRFINYETDHGSRTSIWGSTGVPSVTRYLEHLLQ